MKTFLLALCISALSLSTIRSDDACCESKAAAIQTKLQDIDLACLLSKYEALQHARTKMEIQLVLLDTEPSDTAPERQPLLNRIETVKMHAKRVRQEIEELGKEIKKQEAIAAK